MNGMEKALSRAKRNFYVGIIISAIMIITGFALMDLADEAAKRNVYIDRSAREGTETFIGICIFGGFASVLYDVCAYSSRVSLWKGDFIEAYGKIVTIESDWMSKMRGIKNVVVELNDGRSMKLVTDLDMLFCEGDTGFIGIKGKGLVYINRLQAGQIINNYNV